MFIYFIFTENQYGTLTVNRIRLHTQIHGRPIFDEKMFNYKFNACPKIRPKLKEVEKTLKISLIVY